MITQTTLTSISIIIGPSEDLFWCYHNVRTPVSVAAWYSGTEVGITVGMGLTEVILTVAIYDCTEYA